MINLSIYKNNSNFKPNYSKLLENYCESLNLENNFDPVHFHNVLLSINDLLLYYQNYSENGKLHELRQKIKVLNNLVGQFYIPFCAEIVSSGIIEFLFDRYIRSVQDHKSGLIALNTLKYFVVYDIKYAQILADLGFVNSSYESLQNFYENFAYDELFIQACILSLPENKHLFSNYNISYITKNLLRTSYYSHEKLFEIALCFISDFFRIEFLYGFDINNQEKENEIEKINVMSFITYIKSYDWKYSNENESILLENILCLIIHSKFFDPLSLLSEKFILFFEDNITIRNHSYYLSVFYMFFISHFQTFKSSLNFDLYKYTYDLFSYQNSNLYSIACLTICTYLLSLNSEELEGISNHYIESLIDKILLTVNEDEEQSFIVKQSSLILLIGIGKQFTNILINKIQFSQYLVLYEDFIDTFEHNVFKVFIETVFLIQSLCNVNHINDVVSLKSYPDICNCIQNKIENLYCDDKDEISKLYDQIISINN